MKLESLVGEPDPLYFDSDPSRSPQTLVHLLSKHLARLSSTNSELKMAREQEQSSITAIMQMILERIDRLNREEQKGKKQGWKR